MNELWISNFTYLVSFCLAFCVWLLSLLQMCYICAAMRFFQTVHFGRRCKI